MLTLFALALLSTIIFCILGLHDPTPTLSLPPSNTCAEIPTEHEQLPEGTAHS